MISYKFFLSSENINSGYYLIHIKTVLSILELAQYLNLEYDKVYDMYRECDGIIYKFGYSDYTYGYFKNEDNV